MIYNCNTNICCDQQCLKKQLIPTYAEIKIPNTSLACKYTQHKVPNIRIRDEIKYIHTENQQLNLQIYHLHLSVANTWRNTWLYIHHTIEEKLQREAQMEYKTRDKKLNKSAQTQTRTPQQEHTFYPRVVNNTDVSFSNCKMALLQKGLKYNLHSKQKNWLRNLALEAEIAIS